MGGIERIAGLAVLGGIIAPLGTCHDAHPPSSSLPLPAKFAGCREVYSGPICVVDGLQPIRLWLAPPPGVDLSVHVDGRTVPTQPVEVEGGLQYTIAPEPHDRRVSLEGRRGGVRLEWALELSHEPEPPELAAAEKLRKDGMNLAAAQAVIAHLADAQDPRVRAAYLGKAARIARGDGQIPEAIRLSREALILDRSSGRIMGEAHDRGAFAHLLLYQSRRFEEARTTIAPIRFLANEAPELLTIAAYYEGLLALESGDLRRALSAFQESVINGRRLNASPEQRRAGLDMVIHTLQVIGRHADALELLIALRATEGSLSACARAGLSYNLGWYAMQAAAAGTNVEGLDDPAARMREAIRILTSDCREPATLALAWTGLAELELSQGRPEVALEHLDASRRTLPERNPWLEVLVALTEGHIALVRGSNADALLHYRRALELAEATSLLAKEREATLGIARALEELGRLEEAIAAYDRADRLLDRIGMAVPLGEGRDAFLAANDDGARRRIDLLLQAGRVDDAAVAARRSRARALSLAEASGRVGNLSPAEREQWYDALAEYREAREALDAEMSGDWSLPADELARRSSARGQKRKRLGEAFDRALAVLGGVSSGRAFAQPEPGGLFLIYHPVNDGWVGIALDGAPPAAVRLGPLTDLSDRAAAARQLVLPFGERIRRAKSLRVLAYGAVADVEFPALSLDGRPLVTHLPVTFGADISSARRVGVLDGQPRAVVIADPRSDLVAARLEADAVSRQLEARGYAVQRLFGENANHRDVRRALEAPETQLVHYAGHGVYAGRDGWEGGLPLADGGWFTVSDVLATTRVPPFVVLSGCDTARTDRAAGSEGLGLAQAFLLAGADTVIAARRPIHDRLAAELMGDLYDPSGGPLDLIQALNRAQSKRADGSSEEWSSFRAMKR